MAVETSAKQLEILKEAVPGLTRVAVLGNPASASHPVMMKEVERAARLMGVQLQILEARTPDEFERAFAAMTRGRAGGLLVMGDGMLFLHRSRLAELAAKSRLPAIYPLREHVEAGGLMAYAANLRDNYHRAARYVDKILKGAKPGDLPIEQPTTFELIVNLRTAKALGLRLPQSVLIRAVEVIE